MKLMLASDIHGSAYYCRKLLALFDREGAERLLLLGDILYHGPRNDLPRDYDPRAVIALLNPRRSALLCVRGNCDTEVDQMVLNFPILADYALLCVDGVTLFATHGHVYNADNPPPLAPGDILLHGHTHVPVWEDHGAFRCFNPGSVSIPKGGSVPGCMTLERGEFRWITLEGETYHTERITIA